MSGGGGGGSQVIGYRYYFDIHMGVCRGPIDQILEIKVGGRTAWGPQLYNHDATPGLPGGVPPSIPNNGNFQGVVINSPNLFGGDKQEGGIVGNCYFLFGKSAQTLPSRMTAMMGGLVPNFRSTFTVYYGGQISAMNPYPKAWEFRIRRNFQGWDGVVFEPALARIIMQRGTSTIDAINSVYAQNPAHIIYECLTNRAWGRGLLSDALDLVSFKAVAQKLYDENFGLCIKWARRNSIQSFIQDVLNHIGGVLYLDRSSGLLKLGLIRGDYVQAELPIMDSRRGLLEISEATQGAPGNAINEVIVSYRDNLTNTDKDVRVQNLALIQTQGGAVNSSKKSYPGLPNAQIALRVAQRDLKAEGVGLRRFNLTFDRSAWDLAPGQAIRIRDLPRNIPDMVVRIGNIEDGTIIDGKIKIVAVQDVFALPTSTFNDVPDDAWVPPNNVPCLGRHEVFEVPYYLVLRMLSEADFALMTDDDGFLGTVCEEGQPLNGSYKLSVKPGDYIPGSDEYVEDLTTICPL